MDNLRRSLAPIPSQAWDEIDELARQTLVAGLSARKFVDVDGPHGMDFACVSLGRLEVPEKQKPKDVRYGVHQVLPLVETRIAFQLNQWELDNLLRGARDPELDALTEAARKLAKFEEEAVYNGFKPAGIAGLHTSIEAKSVDMPLEVHGCIDAITDGQGILAQAGVQGDCALVVNPDIWKFMARNTQGGTVRQLVERQIGGPVIFSSTVKDAVLASMRGGDAELTVGQDIAIGYSHHDSTTVQFYMTESFTFRVVAPEAFIQFKVA